jgi:hypothetical protein
MADQRRIPDDPLGFIKRCIRERKIFWTYHVNMRFGQGPVSRELILNAIDTFEIIEEYPEDKYLPSYLVRAEHVGIVFHVHIATEVAGENVRIVTVYIPDPSGWEEDFRRRRRTP